MHISVCAYLSLYFFTLNLVSRRHLPPQLKYLVVAQLIFLTEVFARLEWCTHRLESVLTSVEVDHFWSLLFTLLIFWSTWLDWTACFVVLCQRTRANWPHLPISHRIGTFTRQRAIWHQSVHRCIKTNAFWLFWLESPVTSLLQSPKSFQLERPSQVVSFHFGMQTHTHSYFLHFP